MKPHLVLFFFLVVGVGTVVSHSDLLFKVNTHLESLWEFLPLLAPHCIPPPQQSCPWFQEMS